VIHFISTVILFKRFRFKGARRGYKSRRKLRYFIFTRKQLSNKIITRQIIGLRFASDEEFEKLVERTIQENSSQKEIKQAVKKNGRRVIIGFK
jgi:nickel-dependent lactate racemase